MASTTTESEIQPGSVLIGPALWRHKVLLFLLAVAGLGAGLAAGFVRSPTYSARVQMSIGRIDVGAPGALSGFAVATQSLAAAYSRAIDADAVVEPVAKQLNVSARRVKRQLSATPIASSPVFVIEARTGSGHTAVRTANAASTALTTYITTLNRSNPDSARLFKEFERAALKYNELKADEDQRAADYARIKTSTNRRELTAAKARTEAALLKQETLRLSYQTSQQGQSSTSLVQRLSPARDATTDRTSWIQIFGLLGLIVGLTLGVLAALASAHRAVRRGTW